MAHHPMPAGHRPIPDQDPLRAYYQRWLISRHPDFADAITALRQPTPTSERFLVAFTPARLARKLALAEARDLLTSTLEVASLPTRAQLIDALTRYRHAVCDLMAVIEAGDRP